MIRKFSKIFTLLLVLTICVATPIAAESIEYSTVISEPTTSQIIGVVGPEDGSGDSTLDSGSMSIQGFLTDDYDTASAVYDVNIIDSSYVRAWAYTEIVPIPGGGVPTTWDETIHLWMYKQFHLYNRADVTALNSLYVSAQTAKDNMPFAGCVYEANSNHLVFDYYGSVILDDDKTEILVY